MKRLVKILVMLFVAWTAGVSQTSYVTPQSQTGRIFNAVGAATISGCLTNQGQNIWFSNYMVTGGTPTVIQYRLEFSYNSDAATCTTGTWFAMSDDATDVSQAEVVGIGSYPYVRANLVSCTGCSVSVTFSSFYSTSSANPSALNGFYNPSQQVRKVVFNNQSAGATVTSASIPAPYGSALGAIMFVAPATIGTSTLALQATLGNIGGNQIMSKVLTSYNSGGNVYIIPTPGTPATSLKLIFTSNSGSGNFSVYYYFFPPGSLVPTQQPGTAISQEATATNAVASVALNSGGTTQNPYIYSVSARCSAGTAQLTISDSTSFGAVLFFSSGTTEVGITTFTRSWNPGLLANTVPGNGATVSLSSCGAGNVGTLDVQGSIF